MLEDIRIKVLSLFHKCLKLSLFFHNISVCFVIFSLSDKIIAQCCQIVANGDLGYELVEGTDMGLTEISYPHAIKAFRT
ncbi:hypothetical protein H5410_062492 [Solanum commersonii]|uniref:Uncharacterized protein n=1 Tax=Solanum commersonii TaxID=4109 RepID=A0A9J5WCT9_SOLCO|nr:hypothetical protein H5410_062492 [Solanum commersonii]